MKASVGVIKFQSNFVRGYVLLQYFLYHEKLSYLDSDPNIASRKKFLPIVVGYERERKKNDRT